MRHQKKGLYNFFFEELIKSSVFSVTIYCSYVALAFSFLFQVFPLARAWCPRRQEKTKGSQKLVDQNGLYQLYLSKVYGRQSCHGESWKDHEGIPCTYALFAWGCHCEWRSSYGGSGSTCSLLQGLAICESRIGSSLYGRHDQVQRNKLESLALQTCQGSFCQRCRWVGDFDFRVA